MKKMLRDHSLSLVGLLLFAMCLVGQIAAGRLEYNEEAAKDGEPQVGVARYLTTGHFGEALFENWESEFLQMGMFVILTAFLYQRGSAESNDPDEDPKEESEQYPLTTKSPWPAKKGGLIRTFYSYSLATALLAMFAISFYGHAVNGLEEYAKDHTGATIEDYLESSRFWFESMQNWQSEFLSMVVLSVLSIFLRQKGSPESKPVNKPSAETGADD